MHVTCELNYCTNLDLYWMQFQLRAPQVSTFQSGPVITRTERRKPLTILLQNIDLFKANNFPARYWRSWASFESGLWQTHDGGFTTLDLGNLQQPSLCEQLMRCKISIIGVIHFGCNDAIYNLFPSWCCTAAPFYIYIYSSSTTQGGGGSFKDGKL